MRSDDSVICAARVEGLVSREVGGELVVYDPASTKTHALNGVAATVFANADGSLVSAQLLGSRAGVGPEQAVRCVAELVDAGLLTVDGLDRAELSRRSLIRRAGAGAAVAAVPFVVSVVAPSVAAAQSGGGGGGGGGDPVAPDAPTSTYVSRSGGVATVSFAQGSDGGSPITNYEYSINGGPWTPLAPADSSSPVSVPGVVGGDTIELRAVNGVGASGPSNTVTVLVESYSLAISRNTAMTFNSGGPYPLDVPSFRLENTSSDPAAKITNFTFTIGDSTRNFDGLIPPSADGNPKPAFSPVGQTNVTPDGNIAGGVRSDVIEWNFATFDPGFVFIFAADIDIDAAPQNVTSQDFRIVFANASVMTVTFSTGEVLSQQVGAMAGLGPFTYSQSAP